MTLSKSRKKFSTCEFESSELSLLTLSSLHSEIENKFVLVDGVPSVKRPRCTSCFNENLFDLNIQQKNDLVSNDKQAEVVINDALHFVVKNDEFNDDIEMEEEKYQECEEQDFRNAEEPHNIGTYPPLRLMKVPSSHVRLRNQIKKQKDEISSITESAAAEAMASLAHGEGADKVNENNEIISEQTNCHPNPNSYDCVDFFPSLVGRSFTDVIVSELDDARYTSINKFHPFAIGGIFPNCSSFQNHNPDENLLEYNTFSDYIDSIDLDGSNYLGSVPCWQAKHLIIISTSHLYKKKYQFVFTQNENNHTMISYGTALYLTTACYQLIHSDYEFIQALKSKDFVNTDTKSSREFLRCYHFSPENSKLSMDDSDEYGVVKFEIPLSPEKKTQ